MVALMTYVIVTGLFLAKDYLSKNSKREDTGVIIYSVATTFVLAVLQSLNTYMPEGSKVEFSILKFSLDTSGGEMPNVINSINTYSGLISGAILAVLAFWLLKQAKNQNGKLIDMFYIVGAVLVSAQVLTHTIPRIAASTYAAWVGSGLINLILVIIFSSSMITACRMSSDHNKNGPQISDPYES